ncbi:MAG: hydroxymethylbilane synthase [Pirellulaceae bacterium]|nr:hydroxymethylbilane synthase [Pirellulaceae bacterium]
MPAPIRLGTRNSALARWQAKWVRDLLHSAGTFVELVPISTQGDRVQNTSIREVGSVGLFTKELQRALLDGRIDLAVHSLKDLPTDPVAGLTLAAVPSRSSPFDALVAADGVTLSQLPPGSRVGTGSLRRQAQLLYARPDLQLADIRGNVDTRLRKLDEGQFDALLLAAAGLSRLALTDRITETIDPQVMIPAVGQGALGLEVREDNADTRDVVRTLDDRATHKAVIAERSLLATLRGGCLAPVGAWARFEEDHFVLDAVVLDPAGKQRLHCQATGDPDSPQQLGELAAQQLFDAGAEDLLAASRA